MSGLDRYLDILNLFGEAKPEWTIAEVAFSLDTPASTVYRTIRELVAAAMLEQAREAHYRLGAAFIEFDQRVRRTDTLIRMSDGLLQDMASQVGMPCAVVLARLYGDTVMCVADARWNGRDIETSYGRGRPQPLTRGATSKMILAQLPSRRLNRLLAPPGSPETAGQTILDLRKELAIVRRCGYAIGRGEVDRDLVGIAAPVSSPEQAIAASLSVIVPACELNEIIEHRLILLATTSAKLMADRLNLPARRRQHTGPPPQGDNDNGPKSGSPTPARDQAAGRHLQQPDDWTS